MIKYLSAMLMICQVLPAQNNSISGRVVEGSNKEALEYATISVYSADDSTLLNGTVSDLGGQFTVQNLPATTIYCIVEFLGFQPFQSASMSLTSHVALGEIALNPMGTHLQQVIVSRRAVTSAHKLEKQVYSASQFKNAQGGTASDLVSNLPSASINSFGEISIRGSSGFLVMINGKAAQGNPQTILQQLPANSIENIEVVTAPSAKFDPDGNAGIINIKTKKQAVDGSYLLVNVLTGLPSIEPYDNARNTPRYGADVTYNLKKNKWDVSTGLDYRRYDISGRREGYVNTYLDGILTEFPSNGERSFDELNYSGRASISYAPTPNQTLTAGVFAGKRTKDRTADILYLNQQSITIPEDAFLGVAEYHRLYQATNDVLQQGRGQNRLTFFNENLRVRKSDFFIGSIDYQYQLTTESALQVSALYERTILGGPTSNANLAYPNTNQILELQYNDNRNPLDGFRLQLDYTSKLRELDWESGYQYRYLKHPGDFEYLDRDLENNQWLVNPLFTNSIDLERKIHSLYSQVKNEDDKFSYNIGLRLEYFDRKVGISSPRAAYKLDRFNLFPSVALSYALGSNYLVKASYNKRIERTTTFKMTPFPEREHSETLEQGDAELLPEYIDLIEIGLVRNWQDHVLFASFYYRHVENVINRVNTVFNPTILNRIYTNAGEAEAIGLEVGSTIYPSKNWRLNLGGNVYNYQIKGTLFDDAIHTSNTIYSLNLNSLFNISKTLTLQLGLTYLSERVTAQGLDSEFYNPTLVIQKTFSDNRFSLALQWQNIDLGLWHANEQRITTWRSNFYTTTNYVYEVDIVQLTLRYQLNQISRKVNLPKSEFGAKEF